MSARRIPASVKERRRDAVFAIALAAGVAVLAWVVITMQQLSHDLRTANDARDALATQVQKLGATPVAGPSGSRGEPGKSIVGARGPKGEKGDPGASGKPAPTITPSPGPSGASGAPGKDGADSTVPGPTGPPGADSTVPGPTGPAGQDGRDGADGTDGKPPAGWTFTYHGVEYTCHPVDGFDPDNPKYDCDASEPSPGQKNSGQNPLAMGLDPSRREW